MEEAITRLFTYIVIGLIVWAILMVLIFYAKIKFAQYIQKEKIKRNQTLHEIRKGGSNKSNKSSNTSVTSKPVMIDNSYEQAKTIFNVAMKNGQLSRQDILGLLDLINKMLGNESLKYEKYYFKNNCHEIYVKLKNGSLNQLDYQMIVDYLLKETSKDKSKAITN
jgi:hypothetical protein